MAAHPIVVIDHGTIRIPEQLKNDPRFQDGATLQLVPVASAVPSSTEDPKGDWRRLRGLLKNIDVDLNEELRKDRLAELAMDERMLHGRNRSS